MRKLLALAAAVLMAGSVVVHAGGALPVPPDPVKFRPSNLPGYQVTLQKCSICHSSDYVAYQPPGMKLPQWSAEVEKMRHAYGAPVDDEEARLIAAYLASEYGDAAGVASLTGTTVKESALPPAVERVDVQQLLARNACLSCHAVDKKIVGPSYQDVATRYAAKAEGQAGVVASIRKGSTGRWGDAQMPAFEAMTADEVNALAGYVLGQVPPSTAVRAQPP